MRVYLIRGVGQKKGDGEGGGMVTTSKSILMETEIGPTERDLIVFFHIKFCSVYLKIYENKRILSLVYKDYIYRYYSQSIQSVAFD